MLVVLITLTPGGRNELRDCHNITVRIAVLPNIDLETQLMSTLELLDCAYGLQAFRCEWLHNTNYTQYWPLFTTHDEWNIVKNVMEVLRPFRYGTLWMMKRHTFSLHHVITMYKDMFNHLDGVMRALANKRTQWKEALFCTMMSAPQRMSGYYGEVTRTMAVRLISVAILEPFQKLQSC